MDTKTDPYNVVLYLVEWLHDMGESGGGGVECNSPWGSQQRFTRGTERGQCRLPEWAFPTKHKKIDNDHEGMREKDRFRELPVIPVFQSMSSWEQVIKLSFNWD